MSSISPNLTTQDERIAIRNTILLPLMVTICENKVQEIERSKHTLKKLYAAATELLMKQIAADLVKTRRYLAEQKIKVFPDQENKLKCEYSFRGYRERMELLRDLAKAEIEERMGEYVARVMKLQ
ncbi:hypothetical protein [Paenibacillus sp. MBLB4367]|uniref:hypothetical protein n=1 Tax=Paenibacillus sp. MBLB4367 TaxID=3384767 RepID=UPI0039083FA1